MRSPKLWTPYFVLVITVAFFASFMAQGLSSTVYVFSTKMGASGTYAGVISAIFPISAIITRMFFGFIVDITTRRRVLFIGVFSLIAGILGAAFSPNLEVYAAMRAVQSFGWGIMTTAASTMAADVLPEERRGEGIGYYGLGQAISMSIGPAVALYFVMTDPPQNVYYALASFGSIAVICAILLTYEKHPERLPETAGFVKRTEMHEHSGQAQVKQKTPLIKQIKESFEWRVWLAMVPPVFIGMGYGFSLYYGATYGTSIRIENTGWYFTISALSMIVVRVSSRKFLDTVAPIKILIFACSCGVVGFSCWLAAPALPALFYIAGVFYGVFLGVNVPLNQSVAVKTASIDHWGMANTAYLNANDLGYMIGLIAWGIISDAVGLNVALALTLVMAICAAISGWFCYPNHGKK